MAREEGRRKPLTALQREVLEAARYLFQQGSTESILLATLCGHLSHLSAAAIRPALETLHRRRELAVYDGGGRAILVFSSPEVLGEMSSAAINAKLSGNEVTRRMLDVTTPIPDEACCEHSQKLLKGLEEAHRDNDELRAKLLEQTSLHDGLAKNAEKAANKQRKAEAAERVALELVEQQRRQQIATNQEIASLRQQVEELTKLAEQIPELEATIRELQDKEVVSGSLAERILALTN